MTMVTTDLWVNRNVLPHCLAVRQLCRARSRCDCQGQPDIFCHWWGSSRFFSLQLLLLHSQHHCSLVLLILPLITSAGCWVFSLTICFNVLWFLHRLLVLWLRWFFEPLRPLSDWAIDWLHSDLPFLPSWNAAVVWINLLWLASRGCFRWFRLSLIDAWGPSQLMQTCVPVLDKCRQSQLETHTTNIFCSFVML